MKKLFFTAVLLGMIGWSYSRANLVDEAAPLVDEPPMEQIQEEPVRKKSHRDFPIHWSERPMRDRAM